ncbi:MAG: alpha-L-fucosidase [Rikenellaceae bacterium]
MKKSLLCSAIAIAAATSGICAEVEDFYIYKKLPELQLEFVNTRYQAYFHYNMCTFKNLNEEKHFGRCDGTEPISMFAPKGLDCAQWAEACKAARMEGGWLTTKHHGGFCLWDSKFTTYDVGSARDKRDVVAEFVKEFRKAGLKVGLYYSILDYHHGIENGSVTQTEMDFMLNQIRELLTNYGPIDYINFDGWSSWPTTPDFDDIDYGKILRLVKSIQPDCLIISHTYESNLAHAEVPFADAAGRKYPYHPEYMRPVAASDILQFDWWWDDNHKRLKGADYVLSQLESYNSKNGVYILNMSPNPHGKIDQDAIDRLKEVAERWERPADLKKVGKGWGYSYDVNNNKAFMRRAVQSSTADYIRDKRSYPRAEIAVDGIWEGLSEMEQCSITLRENNPWWRVDLGQVSDINTITIFNCTDIYTTMLQNYTVEVWDAAGNVVWSSTQSNCPRPSIKLSTGGVKGQFVHIKINGRAQLSLAEVIVE